MIETKYPECEKLKDASEKSQSIGEFLEWLGSTKDYCLAEWKDECVDHEDCEHTEILIGVHYSTEKLLAEFFSIDLDKVEKERQHILNSIREK